MPQQIEVPGQGVIEFPDEMSDEQISLAIKNNFPATGAKKEPTGFQQVRASLPGRIVQGIGDAGLGALQLLSKIPGVDKSEQMRAQLQANLKFKGMQVPDGLLPQSIDEQVRQGEKSYQDARVATGSDGFDAARLTGNILSPANLLVASKFPQATSLLRKVAYNTAAGAGTAAMQPVTEGDDYWSEKGKQATIGGLLGGTVPLAIGALARMIKPNTRPEVQALMKEGVTPTPGQILGGTAQRMEEGATSVPIFGDSIKKAQTRAVEDLNRAAINRALSPIGKSLPKNAPVGYDAVEAAGSTISGEYDKLLPKLNVTADAVFTKEMHNVRQMATNLPQEQAQQFENILKNDVIGRFTSAGKMAGETMKEVESKLGLLIRRYGRSENPDHQTLADALKETQATLRRMVERGNPQYRGELKGINEAYANLLRVENAAARIGSKEGVFSPAALRGAVRAMDPSLRKRSFSRGNALMQDLADAGVNVLGHKVPDSGTPFRVANLAMGASGAVNPMVPATAGAAGLLYSRPSQKIIAGLLTQRPKMAEKLADELRALIPFISPVSGLLGNALLEAPN